MEITALIQNAKRLGHGSHTVAAAAYLLGIKAQSLCCWCADSVDGNAVRLPAGGECQGCYYVGSDCLIIAGE